MTGWRVSTATERLGQFWLGTADKPELIGVSMLPCAETARAHERAQAIADAMNRFDESCECQRRPDAGAES